MYEPDILHDNAAAREHDARHARPATITLAEWCTLFNPPLHAGNMRALAREGRLPGAYLSAATWLLPRDTPKPPPLPAGRPPKR